MEPPARPAAPGGVGDPWPATGELSAVADLLARAFRDNPMNQAVLRRAPAARVRANRCGARLQLRAARRRGHLLVERPGEGDGPRGAIIGFAPDRPAPGLPGAGDVILMLRQGLGVAGRWAEVQAAAARIRPVTPHWTLSMLGVDPVCQGQGVGRRLAERWLARVDAAAVAAAPAWVETDRPELVGFYEGLGFERAATFGMHGVEITGLVRSPRSAGGRDSGPAPGESV